MIEALIFDFDGLIVDTETPALASWQALYTEHGHELDHDLWLEFFLNFNFDPVAHLKSLCGDDFDLDTGTARRNELKTKLCNDKPLLPGVLEWITEAKSKGLKLAVATGSKKPWVEHHLKRCDIMHLFDAVCSVEEVTKSKPSPDLFLLAAKKLGISPANALVLEDSPNGLKAAISAGMNCVVIPNEVTQSMSFPPNPWRLNSLADESLGDFLSRSKLS